MAQDDGPRAFLAPPAITALKTEAASHLGFLRGQMERTTSADIRAEGRELQEAAEQTLNVILDVTLDGNVRWVSPTWQEVVGTTVESIKGKAVADILVGNKNVFSDAIEAMQNDDSGSKFIRFSVTMGPQSAFNSPPVVVSAETGEDGEAPSEEVLNLEAQGIIVYDRSAGQASHTMWMVRPSILREVMIDLPEVLVESLGDGAELLAQHLTHLADVGDSHPQHNPPPLPVLCRICERQITPWWFPKHTELCLQEHRAEAELQLAQENLSEHRNAIVAVLDALEAQARYKPSMQLGDPIPPAPPPVEYKGLPIGSNLSPSTGRGSPGSSPSSSGSSPRQSPGRSHSRARSFVVRRPLSRIVELILDVCDTALEINHPVLKDPRGQEEGEYRTSSPRSEGRISQVVSWQSPTAGFEHETGLSLLCDDTAALSRAKVEAVLFFRRILDYSERIRNEFTSLVQECIDAALKKAAKIAAGEDSSDSADDSNGSVEDEVEQSVTEVVPERWPESTQDFDFKSPHLDGGVYTRTFTPSFDGQSAMSLALRSVSPRSPSPTSPPKAPSASSSPNGSATPKYVPSSLNSAPFGPQSYPLTESDPGLESDSSVMSSFRSRPRQTPSPAPELNLPRLATSRERKRTSLILPRATSSDRQQGYASGGSNVAISPLRIPKPRLASGIFEQGRLPIISPVIGGSEFASPTLLAAQISYHRRQSSNASTDMARAVLSPRLSLTNNPQPRAVPPSIKDFEIIKPISKGAFGSVYLAKKKSTGDYYAIKALKKADMIAKNQVANVKAERAILMWQGESDFVAKLYWTFPSKDYIFLVMEYLNGGDCASLLHALGTLTEEWAKKYMAEVILGVEHLHSREIVHRDLKPDNFLIDQKGHLKLTDFGLSRMGLVGRQARAQNSKNVDIPPDPLKQGQFRRSISMASSRSASATFEGPGSVSPGQTPNLTPVNSHEGQPSYFSLSRDSHANRDLPSKAPGQQSEAADTDQLQAAFRRFSLTDGSWAASNRSSPREEAIKEDDLLAAEGFALGPSFTSTSVPRICTPPPNSIMMPPPPMALFDPDNHNRKFVGTPDYLAPETINGVGQDEMSDWWSLGCILFEFLFGYPPFHADTPEQVFENILTRRIDWPDDDEGVTPEARDLMNSLMCFDSNSRLGANADGKFSCGGEEIRSHPWFSDIDWTTLNETEPDFIPAPEHPEDTEYFDARGATSQDFSAEFRDQDTSPLITPNADFERPHDALSRVRNQVNSIKRGLMPLHIPPHVRDARNRRLSEPVVADDFGQFSFKNLPVLERANKDVIQKLRAEALQVQSRGPVSSSMSSAVSSPSLEGSPVIGAPVQRSVSITKSGPRSASPSTLSHTNSSPSRASQPSSPLVQFCAGPNHERRKTSTGASFMPIPGANLQPGSFFDVPRLSSSFRSNSTASSPVRSAKPLVEKMATIPSGSSPRARSQTVGSNESDTGNQRPPHHYKRRSQAIDISPSSSDTDVTRQKALLRVQKRRQRSRRLSQISISDGPMFRPLDILVCEDHPVSSLVMSKLLEKLRCRTIVVHDGGEAMRYAMSSVKFDLIMMEFRLPQINGADVARMIRETKNTNSHTPVVAVTGYLKDLHDPHHFDALVEKPPTMSKLTEVISRLCSWKPQSFSAASGVTAMIPPSSLRKASLPANDSPASNSSEYTHQLSSYRASSREDSMSSISAFTDPEARNEEGVLTIGKSSSRDWSSGVPEGLGISESLPNESIRRGTSNMIPILVPYESVPVTMESEGPRISPSAEIFEAKRKAIARERAEAGNSGDDEDEELGRARPRSRSPQHISTPSSSKHSYSTSTEMFRTGSHNTILSPRSGAASVDVSPAESPSVLAIGMEGVDGQHGTITPPFLLPLEPGSAIKVVDMDADVDEGDPEQTSRASTTPRRANEPS